MCAGCACPEAFVATLDRQTSERLAVFPWHGGGKKREKKREKREKEREKKRKKKEKKKRKKRKKKRKEEKKEEEKIGRKTRKGDNEAYYSYQK